MHWCDSATPGCRAYQDNNVSEAIAVALDNSIVEKTSGTGVYLYQMMTRRSEAA